MSYLATREFDPIEVMISATKYEEERFLQAFRSILTHSYQFEIFKVLLDFSATLALDSRLVFSLANKQIYQNDAGNCRTLEDGFFDRLLKKFKKVKSYNITLRTISSDVLIHEIAHMAEKELAIDLSEDFKVAMKQDIANLRGTAISSVIYKIMVEELKGYNHKEHLSELFARYFELIVLCKEIGGVNSKHYTFEEIANVFVNTSMWMHNIVLPKLQGMSKQQIMDFSTKYIKPISNVPPKWEGQKIQSIHSSSVKWSKTLKSNFD